MGMTHKEKLSSFGKISAFIPFFKHKLGLFRLHWKALCISLGQFLKELDFPPHYNLYIRAAD